MKHSKATYILLAVVALLLAGWIAKGQQPPAIGVISATASPTNTEPNVVYADNPKGSGLVYERRDQQPQKPDTPPDVPDKVALQIRNEQLAQARAVSEFQSLQRQLDESPLGKRMKELQSQFAKSNETIQALSKSACGEKFTLEVELMRCNKVEAAKTEVKKPSP